VDRRALPFPEQRRPALNEVFVAPRTPTEQSLAELWAQILHIDRVGIHDNFFELGGHSLLAMQFVTRFRNKFNVDLPLRALFDNPTIEGVALELMKTQVGAMNGAELASLLANLEYLANEELKS